MSEIINIGPLPFYQRKSGQHRFKDYAFGNIAPLASPTGVMPSFQFIYKLDKSTEVSEIRLAGFEIYKINAFGKDERIGWPGIGDIVFFITIVNRPDCIIIYTLPTFHKVVWASLETGYYFLRLFLRNNAGESYEVYSEVFASCNTNNHIHLQYTNNYNFKIQDYPIYFESFIGDIYLDTKLGRPEYIFEEEVTERLGYSFIESQVSKKVYKFVFLAPEFLLDALRIVRLCNTKICYFEDKHYDMLTFNMNPSWEEQGDLASVEAEFETDNIITNLGGDE